MHRWLWSAQILLAILFLPLGIVQVVVPIDQLAAGLPSAQFMSAAAIRLAGLAECLGACGLILPAAFRVRPWLTPLAALLLAVVMLLALCVHAAHGELAVGPIVLGALCAWVAWGRFRRCGIEPRA